MTSWSGRAKGVALSSAEHPGIMDLIRAAILGIIQGLTEFLPISSSGHLILARDAMQWGLLADPHLNKMFDVALHAGTFLALVAYFRSDIVRLLSAFFTSLRHGLKYDPDRRLAWAIAIGTIPAAIAGVKGEKIIEEKLGTPALIAAELIVFALLLWLADRRGRKRRDIGSANISDGIVIGIAQTLSLAPGVSRSGITMTAGLMRSMTRETAARFSFLLSIPIVGGTAAYSLVSLIRHPSILPPGSASLFLVGTLAALISGYLCIRYFLRYLQTRTLMPFVVYRILLGVAILAWSGMHR
jgi:undecaprenyl-diphosphatase